MDLPHASWLLKILAQLRHLQSTFFLNIQYRPCSMLVCYQLTFLSYTFLPLLHFVSYMRRQVCTPHENDSTSLNLCPLVFVFIKLSILSDFFSNWFLHRIWLPWSVPWRTSRIHSSATLNAKWVTVINSCYFESILQSDWSKKIAPLSQLIRFRTKTNYVTGVFLRSRQFVRFRFDLLLASCDIFLSSYWLWLLWFWFTTLNRKALHDNLVVKQSWEKLV